MGVPKFFKWVVDKWPAVLVNEGCSGLPMPVVDNLYLDMNGIVHQCAHSSDGLTTDISFQEIYLRVVTDIDRLVSQVVRPQQLLFIAVDGVAPRAKLNQQRARRFRSARDRQEMIEEQLHSGTLPPSATVFDSNCITPGTDFMIQLSDYLRSFIDQQLREQKEGWRHLTVHFSGAEVPGEGEHKIVRYIRELRQKSFPVHRPNVRHCIHGADADMLMLALATHEPFFLVLRDVPLPHGKGRRGANGGATIRARGKAGRRSNEHPNTPERGDKQPQGMAPLSADAPLAAPTTGPHRDRAAKMCFVRINILRELLYRELLEGLPQSAADIERAVDDFVFLTFLVGNDFLPMLPAMNIGDQAFDIIFEAYKTALASDNEYLVKDGQINFATLQVVLSLISPTQVSLFVEGEEDRQNRGHQLAKSNAAKKRGEDYDATTEAATSNDMSVPEIDYTAPMEPSSDIEERYGKHSTEYYVRRYYTQKLHIDLDSAEGVTATKALVLAYMEGLQWCLSYYMQGCVSWSWFYPYHYSPFVNELCTMFPLQTEFAWQLSAPLAPFQQLLACLPPPSRHLLPQDYWPLFTHKESPLLAFYPDIFEEDLNGKKQAYEAVIILPFIDKELLEHAERSLFLGGGSFSLSPSDNATEGTKPEATAEAMADNKAADTVVRLLPSFLTAEEQQRNSFGTDSQYSICRDLGRVIVLEIPSSTSPSPRGFAPQLTPGTATSLPSYPNLDKLPPEAFFKLSGVKNSFFKKKGTKGSGKGRNVFAEQNAATQAPLCMPGTVSTPCETALCSRDTPLDAAMDKNAHSAGTAGGSVTIKAGLEKQSSPRGGLQIRFLFDDQSSIFLATLCEQLRCIFPLFRSQLDMYSVHTRSASMAMDGLFCLRSTAWLSEDHTSVLMDLILPKMVGIFSQFRLSLLPKCRIDADTGVVAVQLHAVDHFEQIEQFILDRLKLEDTAGGGSVFEGHLTLGRYNASNMDHTSSFTTKLEEELIYMVTCAKVTIPQLVGSTVQLIRLADGQELQKPDGATGQLDTLLIELPLHPCGSSTSHTP